MRSFRLLVAFWVFPLASGQFDDPALGYCLPDYGLANLEATQLLFKSHVEDVDAFLEVYEIGDKEVELAVDLLCDYAKLTRLYLPEDRNKNFNDRSILQAVMFAQAEGPDRDITEECSSAIVSAVDETVPVFNFLMFVGFFFNFTLPEAQSLRELHEPIDMRLGLSWILQQMEESTVSFTRFIRTMLGVGEAFGDFEYLDTFYLGGIASWEELATSPVSIVSKYASVYLTDGELLEPGFDELVIDGVPASEYFEGIYDRTIETCNSPPPPPPPPPPGSM